MIRHRNGFTFVEIIIGLAIFVIVMVGSINFFIGYKRNSVGLVTNAQVQHKLRAVEEAIRRGSASDTFDSMDETDFNRTGTFNPQIHIASTIKPVDPQTRTREVILVAKWKRGVGVWDDSPTGNVRTLTHTFTIAPLRATVPGVLFIVKIVKDNDPSVGVPGVVVSGPGMDTTEVIAHTLANGEARLYGLLASAGSVNVKINAAPVRAYFAGTPPAFSKTVQTTNTQPGATWDAGTFPVIMPGKAVGFVRDILSDAPVSGAKVFIYPRVASLPILETVQMFVETDGDGKYIFEGLQPADYRIYFDGHNGTQSTQYASLGKPGDVDEANCAHFVVPTDAAHAVPTIYPIQKGTMEGTLKTVVYNSFVLPPIYTALGGSDAPNNFVIQASRQPRLGYHGGTQFNFQNTNFWNKYAILNTTANWLVGGAGYFSSEPNFPQCIFDNGSVFPNDAFAPTPKKDQYTIMTFRTPQVVKAPFTPTMVLNPGPVATTKILLKACDYSDCYELNLPVTGPPVLTEDFDKNMYPNGLDPRNENTHLYSLDASAFSNMYGTIRIPALASQNLLAGGGKAYVTTWWGFSAANGKYSYGGLAANGSGDRWFSRWYRVSAESHDFIGGNNVYTYNMMTSPPGNSGQRPLMPTLDGDLSTVQFVGFTGMSNVNHKFLIEVEGWTKELNAVTGATVSVRELPLNIPSITMDFYYQDPDTGGRVSMAPSVTGQVSVDRFRTASNGDVLHDTKFRDEWYGDSPSISLVPGTDHPNDINVPSDSVPRNVDAGIYPNSTTEWGYQGPEFVFQHNPIADAGAPAYVGPVIRMYKRSYLAATNGVYGDIIDVNGLPVFGAVVELTRTGVTPNTITLNLANNVNHYDFQSHEFLPYSNGSNLCVEVIDAGPNHVPGYRHCFEAWGLAVSERRDFILPVNPANPPGGGGL